jgi:hypothetical protein
MPVRFVALVLLIAALLCGAGFAFRPVSRRKAIARLIGQVCYGIGMWLLFAADSGWYRWAAIGLGASTIVFGVVEFRQYWVKERSTPGATVGS